MVVVRDFAGEDLWILSFKSFVPNSSHSSEEFLSKLSMERYGI